VAQIAELTGEFRAALQNHVDDRLFRSLLIDLRSATTAVTMLSEIGGCRDRYPSAARSPPTAGKRRLPAT
jgi:hypothetical protein